MPRRPPSPAAETPETCPSSVFLPDCPSTRVIVPSSREDTSRSPSGSGARPQGVLRSSATVRTTFTEPFAGGVASTACWVGVDPEVAPLDEALSPPSGEPPPPPPPSEEQPAVSRSVVAASTAVTARRCTIMVPSKRRVLPVIHRSRLPGSRSPGPDAHTRPHQSRDACAVGGRAGPVALGGRQVCEPADRVRSAGWSAARVSSEGLPVLRVPAQLAGLLLRGWGTGVDGCAGPAALGWPVGLLDPR